MSKTESNGPELRKQSLSVGKLALALLWLALAVSCGDSAPIRPPGTGAFSGSGGSTGTGGMAGVGGAAGTGGASGMTGSGGAAGTAGMAGSSGTAGTGGAGACVTTALCRACPSVVLAPEFLCNLDGDCFPGYSCVPSGCETDEGAPIGQCQPAAGGSCVDSNGDGVPEPADTCPNLIDYRCMTVPFSGTRCVRVTLTPECDPDNETYDCQPGFSCEGPEGQETCVDRRVPYDDVNDCPKSHVVRTNSTARFCVRAQRTCHVAASDCAGFGSYCTDIDGDSIKECVGHRTSAPGIACENATCRDLDSSAPVCELGASGNSSDCGDYGLCRTDADCDTDNDFSCVGLWQDGRKECVKTPRSGNPSDCDHVTDCELQQVCAAHRNGDNGGRPSCQTGSAP